MLLEVWIGCWRYIEVESLERRRKFICQKEVKDGVVQFGRGWFIKGFRWYVYEFVFYFVNNVQRLKDINIKKLFWKNYFVGEVMDKLEGKIRSEIINQEKW